MKYQYIDQKDEHLHTLDDKPLLGTSTVVGVIAKPLTWWASGLAVAKFGWINPKINPPDAVEASITQGFEKVRSLDLEGYKNLVAEAYKAHSVKLKDSATAGTDLHQQLEFFVRGQMGLQPIQEYDVKIQPFIDWSKENVKRFLYSEAHCFDEELWVGGISDTAAELNSGEYVLFDFKSSKDAYFSAFVQAAGYVIQIEKNGLWDASGNVSKKLEKNFDGVAVVPFGAEVIEPIIKYNIEDLKNAFKYAVGLYKIDQQFKK